MRQSKEERSTFTDSFGDAIFLLPLPILIVACVVFMHVQFPGFVTEIISVFAITAVTLIVANRSSIYKRHADSIMVLKGRYLLVFRNMMIATTSSLLLLALADSHNSNKNSMSLTLCIIIAVVIVIVITVLATEGNIFTKIVKNREYLFNGFTLLLTVLVTAWLLIGLYTHWSTQYIWLPAVSLTMILAVLHYDYKISERKDCRFRLADSASKFRGVSLCIAVISTICQFWFVEVFGVSLWQIYLLIGVVGLVILISWLISGKFEFRFIPILILSFLVVGVGVTLYFFWATEILPGMSVGVIFSISIFLIILIIGSVYEAKKIRKKKLEKKQYILREVLSQEEKEKIKSEKENNEKLVTLAFKAIADEDEVMWNEILYVVRHYSQDINKFSSILPKIHKAPLEQVVAISKIKKQIVWNGDLQVALQVIEKLAIKSYKDEELELLIKQIDDFVKLIDRHKDFAGYDEAMKEVSSRCSTIYKMLPKE